MRKYHIIIACSVLLVDRLTKWFVAQKIELNDAVDVIPGLFRLTHLQNEGAAFSLFADSASPWRLGILILFSVMALTAASVFLWKNGNVLNGTAIALSLVAGGALGNLWDRVSSGRVTDFLDFYLGSHHWPPFNVADSAIVIGGLLLISKIVFAQQKEKAIG
jgi:signal peptidase II